MNVKIRYIILFISLIGVLSFAVSIPASAEHVTCSTSTGEERCSVLIDWHNNFLETPLDPPSEQYFSYDNKRRSFGTLATGRTGAYRNLYQGIWTIRNQEVSNMLVGERSPNSDKFWYEMSSNPNFEPRHISSRFSINAGELTSASRLDYDGNNDVAKLQSSQIAINTWSSGGGYNDNVYFDEYENNEGIIGERIWDWDSWDYRGEFTPTHVDANVQVSNNSSVFVGIYPPTDSEQNEEARRAYGEGRSAYSSADVTLSDNYSTVRPSGYDEDRIGFVTINGSDEVVKSPSIQREQIRHITQDGDIEYGLKEYHRPIERQTADINTIWDAPAVTYHIQIRMFKSDKAPLGISTNGSAISLTRPLPTYRYGNNVWMGYPSVLPTIDDNANRGERFSVSSTRSGEFGNAIFPGHSEQMIQNYNDKYLEQTNHTTSYAPRIPRDSPRRTTEGISEERFYNAEIAGPEYHVIDGRQDSDDKHVFFHHVYSDIPRVERSIKVQDQYENIESGDWQNIMSDDGAVYTMFDGAVGDTPPDNTNYYGEQHESPDEIIRYYEDFEDAVSSTTKFSEDNLAINNPTDEDESTGAIRMKYSIDKIEIKPEIGTYYQLENGGEIKSNITQYSFRDEGYDSYEYSKGNIEQIVQEYINENNIRSQGDPEFKGFYTEIEDVRVTYNIDYEYGKLQTTECPSVENDRDWSERDGDISGKIIDSSGSSNGVVVDDKDTDDDGYLENVYYDYIYDSYSSYLSSETSNSEYINSSSADGIGDCKNNYNHNGVYKYVSGVSWESIDDWEYISDYVTHDDEFQITYNASDDIVEGNPEESTTYDYRGSFSSTHTNETFNEEDFEIKTAYGVDTETRHYINRQIDEDNPHDTRWTRAEATQVTDKRTVILDQEGDTSNTTYGFPEHDTIFNRFDDAQDRSGITPSNGEYIEGQTSVYLDLYNFGPSMSGESVSLYINGESVTTKPLTQLNTDNRYSNYRIVLEEIDISEYIDDGDASMDIKIEYSRTENSDNFNADQRFDYIVKFETNHPVDDVTSRWGYATFRDTRYDSVYKYDSYKCLEDRGPQDANCYNFDAHSVPYMSDQGEFGYHHDNAPPEFLDTIYPSGSMFVHPYLVPSSNSVRLSNSLSSTSRASDGGGKIGKIKDIDDNLNSKDSTNAEVLELDPTLNSNYCAKGPENSRYCDWQSDTMADTTLLGEYNGSVQSIINAKNEDYIGVIPESDERNVYREFRHMEFMFENKGIESWEIAGDATWETTDVKQDDVRIFDKPQIEVQAIGNLSDYFEDREKSIEDYRDRSSTVVQHEFYPSVGDPNGYEQIDKPDDYYIQQFKLKVTDRYGQPISFVDRLGNPSSRREVTSLDTRRGLPISKTLARRYVEDDSNNIDNEWRARKAYKFYKDIREGVCIKGETIGKFKDSSGNVTGEISVGTRPTSDLTESTYVGNPSVVFDTADSNCYMTDDNGELFFTLAIPKEDESYQEVSSVDGHEDVNFTVEIVGSEQYWWKYDSNERLLESSSLTRKSVDNKYNATDTKYGSAVGTLLDYILFFIGIIFILAMMSRVRPNPQNGYTTKELIYTMFSEFSVAINRFMKLIGYLILISIAIITLSIAFSSGSNPFLLLEILFEAINDALF